MMHLDWQSLLYGATLWGIVGHAVNTFPTPKNQYGQWLLGILKMAVGQRLSAMNAFRGSDTVAIPVPQGTGAGVQKAQSQPGSSSVQIGPESIKIKEQKETVIPTGIGGTGTRE